MTRFALPLLLIAGLALTGAAPQRRGDAREQARFDSMLAGLRPGAPQHCIRRSQVTEILPFADTALFRQGRARVWRNDLSGHCAPALHLHAACAAPRFRHLEWFHDHVRIEQMLFDGVTAPADGALRPDLSRPGMGLELKRQDAERFAA